MDSPKLTGHAVMESDRPMRTYLVGLMYHDPESWALWNRGVIEDYESTTGVFVEAESEEQALNWSGVIAEALLRHVTGDPSLTSAQFGYECWIVPDPRESCWSHCLDFFQHVGCGQMPDLESMTSAAYGEWQSKRTRNGSRFSSG